MNAITDLLKTEEVNSDVLAKNLEALVQKDHKACIALEKASGSEFTAFKTLIIESEKAGVFKEPKLLRVLQARITTVYAKDNPDAGKIRNTILSNVAKVSYGGTVGRESDGTKQTITGKGFKAVQELLDKETSIRNFRLSVVAAKPEGLKRTPPATPSAASAKRRNGTTSTYTRETALRAAVALLEIVTKFLKPSDAALITDVEKLQAKLKATADHDEKEHQKAA